MIDRASLEVPAPLLHERILDWYALEARSLPWREHGTTPWGVLVSEVMLQQTPVARVEPVWRAWMSRWPSPGALAAEATGEAVHAWGRLGYPRRALRLHAAAVVMVQRHRGEVPRTHAELLALPGVGTYTAAAVASFAFGVRAAVVDTNVRRVFARVIDGAGQAGPSLSRAELTLATALLPAEASVARGWNVAVMEVGALVCSARAPRCPSCPVEDLCAWRQAGRPAYEGPVRRAQPFLQTDRQCRGAILSVLREASRPASAAEVQAAWPADDTQRERCLDSLVADGLVERLSHRRLRLPGR
ncbi:MAG: A/G-specific adenine glycosylase [Dermatophilaceae bacterium]